ncbi:PRC-barrel domain-containing protein [Natrinema salifodinae]|nr:PRC-barrel domain-containing protein [Natrinema salifodinae]
MSELLTQSLVGKSIVGTDGTVFGTLYNITMDVESGALQSLVVDPGSRFSTSSSVRTDDDGRLRIPVNRVTTVNDQIIVRYRE